ncbi:dCTP pyrophosphatase 1-like [Forsythia ovata]|uniref:dCTP pyrophosphatase 1-like n=1 Tax=Forsythia ovata TaxID=205694 RepID=A0ABD1V1A0_9LAMI
MGYESVKKSLKLLEWVKWENCPRFFSGKVRSQLPRGLPDWEDQEKLHVGEELSDVLLYLVRLSDICGIDLAKAALRKLELNAIKYPINLCNQKHNQIKTSPETAPVASTAAADAATSTTSNDNGGV